MLHHPCGSLPVSGLSLGVWYCHHHQAFFATMMVYTERDGDEPERVAGGNVEWGPFDTPEDVQRWIADAAHWVRALPPDVLG